MQAHAFLTAGPLSALVPLFAGLAGPSTAQDLADHPPGVVIPCDFNHDGFGDVLVLAAEACHAWAGAREFPWLSQGLRSELPVQRPVGRPVLSMAPTRSPHLFVTWLGPQSDPRCRLSVLELGPEGELSKVETAVYARRAPLHNGASPRVAEIAPGEVLFVWAEVEPGSEGFLRAARVSGAGAGEPIDLPLPQPVPWGGWRVAGVQSSPAMLADPGTLTIVLRGLAGSFAVVALDPFAMRVLGQRVFDGAPRVADDSPVGRRDPVQLGAFAPTPVLGVPTLRLADHGLLVFHPQVDPPFVDGGGALLRLGPQAHVPPQARADFDGDGAEELLVLERGAPNSGTDLLAVLDPHPWQRRAQFWSIPAGAGNLWGYDFHVYDAAALDVDGDGLADVALSTVDPTARTERSRVSLMLGSGRGNGAWFTFHW